MVAIVIARVKERDDIWFELAMGHLGEAAPVLQNYLDHGDSALLANYIHILRDIVHVHLRHFQSGDAAFRWKVVESVSQFDIQDTLPTLQHDFCHLWNEIVEMARTTDHRTRSILILLLKKIRHAYITLHEGTDSAPTIFSASTTEDEHVLSFLSSYPLCNIPDHRPRRSSHAPVEFSNTTAMSPHIPDVSAPTAFASPILRDNAALPPAPLSGGPNMAFSSAPATLLVDEKLTDVSPPDSNDTFVPDLSTVESHRILATSPAPAAVGATRQAVDPSARTTPRSTSALQHAQPETTSYALNFPSSRPPTAIPDTMIPMDILLSSSDPPATRSDRAQPRSESHSLMPAATSSASSPLQIPAPHSGATIEGEGSATAALSRDKDTLQVDLPSVNPADKRAALHNPLQLLSLPSVPDKAVAGPSWRTLDAKDAQDYPAHPSNGHYDIV
jgi:hypothetical protein